MKIIYSLLDPRDHLPYYVGAGKISRPKNHWRLFLNKSKAVNKRLLKWFEELKYMGLEPIIKVIESTNRWKKRERYWIAYYGKQNKKLCNVLAGGNTPPMDVEARRRAGRIGGKVKSEAKTVAAIKNFSKGRSKAIEAHLLWIRKNPKLASKIAHKNAVKSCHLRWHVSRGITNSKCKLCKNESKKSI